MRGFSRAYSEAAFKSKLGALAGLKDVWVAACELHTLLRDPATPVWVKGICVAALGYLILPTDVVGDFIPGLGYGDDLVALSTAVATIAARWGALSARAEG
jgi:uncharacterized membrane protein YkvA (DUF1232 family)